MIILVASFATSGFEHSIANMFFVDLGLMYGADTTFGKFLYKNLIPVTFGNIIGGGIGVGVSMWYLYGFKPVEKKEDRLFEVSCFLFVYSFV